MSTTGDELLPLLGQPLNDPLVQRALARLAIPWRPEIGEGRRNDSISSGNLELGFEDFAWFHALDSSPAVAAPVLNQICFFAPGAGATQVMMPAFGVEFGWSRSQLRECLSLQAFATRYGERDVFQIGPSTVVVSFAAASEIVDSILVLAEREKRPSRSARPLGFTELSACFGREWYDPVLRSRVYVLADGDSALTQIKNHGSCDLIRQAAVRLRFKRDVETWVFAACEIYRDRVRDACHWEGDMPFGISFEDLPDEVSAKLGQKAEHQDVADLESIFSWSLGAQRVVVTFDNIVNLVSSVVVGAKSYWDR